MEEDKGLVKQNCLIAKMVMVMGVLIQSKLENWTRPKRLLWYLVLILINFGTVL